MSPHATPRHVHSNVFVNTDRSSQHDQIVRDVEKEYFDRVGGLRAMPLRYCCSEVTLPHVAAACLVKLGVGHVLPCRYCDRIAFLRGVSVPQRTCRPFEVPCLRHRVPEEKREPVTQHQRHPAPKQTKSNHQRGNKERSESNQQPNHVVHCFLKSFQGKMHRT